jgi:hypothetical protein
LHHHEVGRAGGEVVEVAQDYVQVNWTDWGLCPIIGFCIKGVD